MVVANVGEEIIKESSRQGKAAVPPHIRLSRLHAVTSVGLAFYEQASLVVLKALPSEAFEKIHPFLQRDVIPTAIDFLECDFDLRQLCEWTLLCGYPWFQIVGRMPPRQPSHHGFSLVFPH